MFDRVARMAIEMIDPDKYGELKHPAAAYA
jgi:hypothetical protein